MRHDELTDLATGYALAALDPEEFAAFEAHLPTCNECAQRVAQMQALAGALPHLLEEIEPPDGLKGRILAAIREESKRTMRATATSSR